MNCQPRLWIVFAIDLYRFLQWCYNQVGELSDSQNAIISIINDKLKDCDVKELNSINAMIDIIRLTYKR